MIEKKQTQETKECIQPMPRYNGNQRDPDRDKDPFNLGDRSFGGRIGFEENIPINAEQDAGDSVNGMYSVIGYFNRYNAIMEDVERLRGYIERIRGDRYFLANARNRREVAFFLNDFEQGIGLLLQDIRIVENSAINILRHLPIRIAENRRINGVLDNITGGYFGLRHAIRSERLAIPAFAQILTVNLNGEGDIEQQVHTLFTHVEEDLVRIDRSTEDSIAQIRQHLDYFNGNRRGNLPEVEELYM